MSIKLIFGALLVMVISGCTGGQQRPNQAVCYELSPTAGECQKHSIINLGKIDKVDNPIIAFIEFDEKGNPYDQASIDNVFQTIEEINQQDNQSVLIVGFIHGWHHNAAQTDRNVIEFKSFLSSLAEEEKFLSVGKPRKIIGLYMGWQGKSSENSIVRLFSYRAKKELGLETGKKSVTPILKKLSKIRKSDKNNRLVLAGHSFGGGVLYSAVKDDLLYQLQGESFSDVKLFGDLVILLNPAIEANRFVDVHSYLKKNFPICTPLSMISLTSEADTALSKHFPAGMKFFYRDQIKGDSSDSLLTTAYGRFSEFSNYELRPIAGGSLEESLSKSAFNSAVSTWKLFRSTNAPFVLGGVELMHKPNSKLFTGEPILNVLVDKNLIQEHNEIWDPKVKYFLRGLIGMEFARNRFCR